MVGLYYSGYEFGQVSHLIDAQRPLGRCPGQARVFRTTSDASARFPRSYVETTRTVLFEKLLEILVRFGFLHVSQNRVHGINFRNITQTTSQGVGYSYRPFGEE